MQAHSKNPTLIRICILGKPIGHVTCEEFRKAAGWDTGFIQDCIKRFNEMKERCGEPERAEQVIQLANGKTI